MPISQQPVVILTQHRVESQQPGPWDCMKIWWVVLEILSPQNFHFYCSTASLTVLSLEDPMFIEKSILFLRSHDDTYHMFTYPKGVHSYRYFLLSNSFAICSCIYFAWELQLDSQYVHHGVPDMPTCMSRWQRVWCTHWLEEVPVWVCAFWVCKPVIYSALYKYNIM